MGSSKRNAPHLWPSVLLRRSLSIQDLSSICRDLNEVPIPFASPKMLYKMKKRTHREKDRADPPVPAGELC